MKLRKRNLSNAQSNSNGSSNSASKTTSTGNKRAKKTEIKNEEEKMQQKLEEKGEEEMMPCYIDKLPTEIMEHFFRGYLNPIDRLRAEPVSKRWKAILQKPVVWKGEMKFDYQTLTRGHPEIDKKKITDKHLIPLFEHIGENLVELDLHSFGHENLKRFIPKIAKSLKLLPSLEKFNIHDFNLRDFLSHLPVTLRELNTTLSIQTLKALSHDCPNLEKVPFQTLPYGINFDTVVELIGAFSRLKKLNLSAFHGSGKIGAFASIGKLKALEELFIGVSLCNCFDEKSLEAIAEGCKHLRSLIINSRRLTEQALFQLANFPELTTLEIFSRRGEFSDTVLKAIASRGQLKRLRAVGYGSEALTDNAIEYLVDKCKSLVSLDFNGCPRITKRSLEVIILEVQRRHGATLKTLPNEHLDAGIFYFNATNQGHNARELIGTNPWLVFGWDPRLII